MGDALFFRDCSLGRSGSDAPRLHMLVARITVNASLVIISEKSAIPPQNWAIFN